MKAPLLSLLLLTSTALAADWPQFRGPDATGVIDDQPPGPDLKIAWQTELPGRGLSSPIIVGDRVFLTCSSGLNQRILHVICLDRQDGHRLWERTVLATGRTMSHKKTCVAAPTPCSDGRRVYALFSSNDLVAFDLDGNLQWLRGLTLDYPNASNSLGMASSPVVIADTLVVQSENDSESLALGLDAATGANRWKMSRPKAANWTSPVVLGEVVGLQSSKGLTGVGLKRKATNTELREGTHYAIQSVNRNESHIALGWEDIKDLQAGETVTKTYIDRTLPTGDTERSITYQAPFFRPDREEDYRVAWAHFEARANS